ncbi:hypothetical protein [Amycolatopsis thailandensis]|nr:hypothetical protein [Amycolatopsis thailandensis]
MISTPAATPEPDESGITADPAEYPEQQECDSEQRAEYGDRFRRFHVE